MLRARERQEAREGATGRRPPGHQPEQDQCEGERAHHLHERVAPREGGAEDHAVGKVHDPTERDARREREPLGAARVVEEVVGDQGARGSDGAEREVQHTGGPVQHDQPDARERVHAPERQADHDERLDELPVDAEHGEREHVTHRSPRGTLIVM